MLLTKKETRSALLARNPISTYKHLQKLKEAEMAKRKRQVATLPRRSRRRNSRLGKKGKVRKTRVRKGRKRKVAPKNKRRGRKKNQVIPTSLRAIYKNRFY